MTIVFLPIPQITGCDVTSERGLHGLSSTFAIPGYIPAWTCTECRSWTRPTREPPHDHPRTSPSPARDHHVLAYWRPEEKKSRNIWFAQCQPITVHTCGQAVVYTVYHRFPKWVKHVCEAGFHLRNSIGEAEVPGISSIQSSAERLSHFMYFTDLFLFIWEDDVGVKCLHHQQSLAQGPRTLPENLKTCAWYARESNPGLTTRNCWIYCTYIKNNPRARNWDYHGNFSRKSYHVHCVPSPDTLWRQDFCSDRTQYVE